MYTLYYSPGACSMAIHIALIEIGAEFTLENVSIKEGKNRTSEYLKINPRGSVPTLVEDENAIREGGAMLIYLLDKHQNPLLPKSGIARAKALEWLMFCNSTLHPAYSVLFSAMRVLKDKAATDPFFIAASERVQKLWDEVDTHLAKNDYLAGSECTAGDILMTVIANWGGSLPQPPSFGANVKRLLKNVSARPSYQKALAAEQVEYKAA